MRLLYLSLFASQAILAPAFAQSRSVCDISTAKCVVNGTKCNIHFRNRTGDSGGSDCSSKLEQSSAAQAVQVKAIDKGGNRVGNKLVLQANEKKTMNIGKKARKDFSEIRIKSVNAPVMYAGSEISCAEIIRTLDGTGNCKLFQGTRKSGEQVQGTIGYQCDSGNVGGPG
jgi:hypothetical protein